LEKVAPNLVSDILTDLLPKVGELFCDIFPKVFGSTFSKG
jgi:hypothetical protein